MKFYDLHVHSAFSSGESSIDQLAAMAKELGYRGFCFSAYYKNEDQAKRLNADVAAASKKHGIDVSLGFEARNVKEIEKLRAVRRKFDVLLVSGGDLELNRKAVETPEVDVLAHPEFNRNDPGLNDVLVKLAARNKVAIEINFREVLNASKATRAKVMRNISHNVRLAKRFKAPVIVSSGAVSHYEMKDPKVLVSFASCLGIEISNSKAALSDAPESLLKSARKRKSEKWVMPGVRSVR